MGVFHHGRVPRGRAEGGQSGVRCRYGGRRVWRVGRGILWCWGCAEGVAGGAGQEGYGGEGGGRGGEVGGEGRLLSGVLGRCLAPIYRLI